MYWIFCIVQCITYDHLLYQNQVHECIRHDLIFQRSILEIVEQYDHRLQWQLIRFQAHQPNERRVIHEKEVNDLLHHQNPIDK
jgi:hypothetical protein